MRVRFWGTRGSLPVAPEGEAIRQRIKRALLKANGRKFESEASVEQFIDAELDFATRHSYGGGFSCFGNGGGGKKNLLAIWFRPRCFVGEEMKGDRAAPRPGGTIFIFHMQW